MAAFFFIAFNRLSALIILIVGVTVDLLPLLLLATTLVDDIELLPFEPPRPLSPLPLFECDADDDPLELDFDPPILDEIFDVADEDDILVLPPLLLVVFVVEEEPIE